MKKRLLLGLMVALLLSLTGCGSSSYDMAATESISMNTKADRASGFEGGYYEKSETTVEESAAVEEAFETEAQNVVETSRKLIKTVHMNVETENFEELLHTIEQRVEALGGYMEQFSSSGMEHSRYSNITARIPKTNLDAFMETIEGASNITYRQESVEDVTLDYVDLESHKKMLLKEQERLLELLDVAETIEDIITIEGRLTEVQYQIESMESQLRTYDNQIDYSTVYLEVEEVVRYTPQEPVGAWERIQTGFMENLYSVTEGIKDFFIGLIISIPMLVVFFVVIGILALLVRLIIKWDKKRADKKRREQQLRMQQIYMQTNGTAGVNQMQNVTQDSIQKGTENKNE